MLTITTKFKGKNGMVIKLMVSLTDSSYKIIFTIFRQNIAQFSINGSRL